MFLKIQKILNKLVKSDCWSHGGFDVEGPDVLPLLLQQGNQEIDGHVDITDSNGQAQNFFHLEFDGLFHFFDFGDHIVSLGQNSWKLTGFVQTWSQQSRNLSDQSIGSQESVVFFGKFLDELLVLVEFFQVIDGHVWDAEFGGFINMGLVTEDANGEFWSSGVWELDGTGESLVLFHRLRPR